MKYPEYKKLDLPEIGNQELHRWMEQKVFEQSVSSREGKPAFTFYEGPPSANGLPGFITLWHVRLRIFFVVIKR
jgi:isoleucyl-tRNA synthetase